MIRPLRKALPASQNRLGLSRCGALAEEYSDLFFTCTVGSQNYYVGKRGIAIVWGLGEDRGC